MQEIGRVAHRAVPVSDFQMQSYIFFLSSPKKTASFLILPEKCLVSSSLVPPMILLTKVGAKSVIIPFGIRVSPSLVRRYKGGA